MWKWIMGLAATDQQGAGLRMLAPRMYRKGWAQPPEYFQARTKYLQLADKAARTVMLLTERLDHTEAEATADHRKARDHEQRHSRPSDNCR
jgi:hypothetical protein